MKSVTRKAVAASLLLGLSLPLSALAADQDLQQKIDSLTQEVEALKHDVSQTKQKSLGQWLSIGGDYRVRFDSLQGGTAAYVNPNGLFSWLGTNALLTVDASSIGFPPGQTPVGTILTQANSAMKGINTYQQAAAAAPQFAGLINTLTGLVAANPLATQQSNIAIPATSVKNDAMYTNRFGLNLHAKATEDVTVNARLLMYKVTGAQDESAITGSGTGPFFADRVGVFDGVIGHVPSDNKLLVDQVYASWKNIANQPIWFSVGRRPSTGGIPSQLKQNNERPGNAGTPASVIDFAFDGGTIGVAPDIDMLPGAYAKVCFGRGFDSGIVDKNAPHLHDTDFLGVAVIPYDTDPLRIDFQWARGFNLFDFPVMNNTAFGNTAPSVELGNVDWYELGALSTLKNVGPGTLNLFGTVAMNVTHPNNSVSANAGFEGLLTGQFFQPEAPTDKTGWVAWVGGRYDVTASGTKIGAEYNHGSKNWFGMVPAADDLWTSKVGTRGNVYEGYVIQELPLKPISSYVSKAFFKAGYQYYDFEYTGSNNWVGAPMKISDITPGTLLLTTPLKKAQDIYVTFEVHF